MGVVDGISLECIGAHGRPLACTSGSSVPVIAAIVATAPQSLATLKQLPQACLRLGEEVPFVPHDKPDGTRYSPKASAPFPSDRLSASTAPAHPAFLSPDRPALHPRAPTLCRRRPKVPARPRPRLNP